MNSPDGRSLLISATFEALARVENLVTPLSDEAWRLPTPCPGWTVADIVAHLTDLEATMNGQTRLTSEPDWEDFDYLTTDLSRLIEVGVQARRNVSPPELLTEFHLVIAARTTQLKADEHELSDEVMGPLGTPTTFGRSLRMRTFDTWVHEQDIRTAIGEPGGWDGLPMDISESVLLDSMPVVWGKKVKAPIGATLHLHLTDRDLDFQYRVDDDGRVRLCEFGDATVRLDVKWPDLVRRMCGRVAADSPEFRATITMTGDNDLGELLLRELTITP